MDTIFKFLFEFLGQFFGAIWNAGIANGIVQMFNFPEYVKIINNYTTTLGGLAWVIAIIAIVLLAAVFGVIIYFIVLSIKKFARFKKKVKDTNDLVNEVNALNKEVMRMNLEKDKILSMKSLNLLAKRWKLSTRAKRKQRAVVSTSLLQSIRSGQIISHHSTIGILHFLNSATDSETLLAHDSDFSMTSKSYVALSQVSHQPA